MGDIAMILDKLTQSERELLIAKLLDKREKNKKLAPVIQRRPFGEELCLSDTQKRMWFLYKLEPENPAYNIFYALKICGELDSDKLNESIRQVIVRHDSLRSTFKTVEGKPKLVVSAKLYENQLLNIIDGTHIEPEFLDSRLNAVAVSQARAGFDLEAGPLYKFTLMHLKENVSILMITMHHIISDGWSMKIFIKEIACIYEGLRLQKDGILPRLNIRYSDYAYWTIHYMQNEVLEEHLEYWKKQLGGCSFVLELPTDYTRPAVQGYQGAMERIRISKTLTAAVNQICKEQQVTLFMFLMSVFDILLYKYTDQDTIIVGTPIANRSKVETENIIGCFVNTLAIKTELDGELKFSVLLNRVREICLNAYKYEAMPFDKLVEELKVERDLSRQAIYQTMLVLQNTQELDVTLSDINIMPLQIDTGVSKLDITLELYEGEELSGWFEYNTELFKAETIKRMIRHFTNILEHATRKLNILIKDICIMDEEEYQTVVNTWNKTEKFYNCDQCIHQLFEQQAELIPDAPAVLFEEEEISYSQLNEWANQLARYIKRKGVQSNQIVAVLMDRCIELEVTLQGILKSGACYMPLDVSSPAERIRFMLEDAGAVTVVTKEQYRPLLMRAGNLSTQIICIDTESDSIENELSNSLSGISKLEDLAYVIYTSGSTGRPKGVMIQHKALLNRILWAQDICRLDETDRVLQKTAMTFDVSVWEFFWPLAVGSTLVMARPDGHRDSSYLNEIIREKRITTIHFVPSMLRVFLEDENIRYANQLRRVILSGEALLSDLQNKFFSLLDVELYNLYGPTEAAIDVTYWACERNSKRSTVPIGYPISNIKLYILDRYLNNVPVGIPGELHIAGIGLGKGYLNRESLTNEKFILNPFSDDPEERLYKTGDLVRYAVDGSIEYLRRMDHQVKIRGMRIELGEIEEIILSHPDVKAAVASVWEVTPENKKIILYITKENGNNQESGYLNDYLKTRLPDYMIPSKWIVLEKIPVTINGKVARKELPPPDFSSDLSEQLIEPQTKEQKILADIWCDVLSIDKVGIQSKFFEMGGDSILCIQVVSRARKAGLVITPKQIFEYQTIETLAKVAQKIEIGKREEVVQGIVKLTPIQKWFFEMDMHNKNHYNQSILLKFDQEIDEDRLQSAFHRLIHHHDALRMMFEYKPDGIIQSYGSWEQKCHILSKIEFGIREPTMEEVLKQFSQLQEKMNIESGQMIQMGYLNTINNKHFVFITAHHLVIDGISWRILLEDLEAFYHGEDHVIKTDSYQKWSDRLHQFAGIEQNLEDTEYFKRLSGTETGHITGEWTDLDDLEKYADTYSVTIKDQKQIDFLLGDIHKVYHTRINDILLVALILAVYKWSGIQALRIDVEGHGREDLFDDIDISRTIGWFTSIYPVLLEIEDDADIKSCICHIKETLRGIPDYGIAYNCFKYLKQNEALNKIAKADILFNYLGVFKEDTKKVSSFQIVDFPHYRNRNGENKRNYLLEINALISSGGLQIDWTYGSKQFVKNDIQNLAQQYIESINELTTYCRQADSAFTISDFSLADLTHNQLENITNSYNDIIEIYPLTPMQNAVLAYNLFSGKKGGNVQQLCWKLTGELDIEAFIKAWQDVINNHDMLRTTFLWKGGKEPLQIVHEHLPLNFMLKDYRQYTKEQIANELNLYYEEDKKIGFRSSELPLMRFFIARCTDHAYEFVWSYYTSLFDNWSWTIILRELFQNYKMLIENKELPQRKQLQFKSYLIWIQQQKKEQAKDFWMREMKGFQSVRATAEKKLGDWGDALHEMNLSIKSEITDHLTGSLKQKGVTLGTFLQGIWILALAEFENNTDIIYGVLTYGRPSYLPDIENIVGLFSNNLPVRGIVNKEHYFLDWLREIQNKQVELRQYDYVSVQQIARWTKVPLSVLQKAIYHRTFILSQSAGEEFLNKKQSEGKLSMEEYRNNLQINVPMRFYAEPAEELNLKLQYDRSVYEDTQVKSLLCRMNELVETVTTIDDMEDIRIRFLSNEK